MKRNLDRHTLSGSASLTRSVSRSPMVYFVLALLLALVVLPLAIDAQIPSIISALYVDVSASNQPFQKQVTELCQERLTYLRKRDVIINAQFADQAVVLQTGRYTAQQQAELLQSCNQILQPSDGVGKLPGTSFSRALASLRSQIQKQQRDQRDRIRTVAVFLLQAAEMVPGQPDTDWKAIKQHLKAITNDGSAVLIMGVEAELQQQLSTLFEDINHVQVLAYSNGRTDLKDIFYQVRQR